MTHIVVERDAIHWMWKDYTMITINLNLIVIIHVYKYHWYVHLQRWITVWGNQRNNCMHFVFLLSNLSFGVCDMNIYGGTLAEVLHDLLLVLCEYIDEVINLIFTQSSLEMISHLVVCIHRDNRHKSKRNILNVDPFSNGLMSVKTLKATERFAMILYL